MTSESKPFKGISRPGLTTWSRRLIASIVLVAFVALIIWAGLALLPSAPQRAVVMAIYPEGSLNAELVKRYQQILGRKGIDLKLANSAGAAQSAALLRDPKSGVSIALIPGGITTDEESPQLVSLGTLFYQPLWVFSRPGLSPEPGRLLLQGHKQLRNLRISIGPEGSSSHALCLELLGRAGVIDRKSAALLPYTPSESADKLVHGKIDIAIFVDGWESPAVQQLLNTKGVNVESIPRADAFAALYPYLNKLVLPAGVIDMNAPKPETDVMLIATKSNLVVRRDLHSAIQYMLLEAAVEIHSTPSIFRKADQFPAPETVDLQLSPLAREFYKTGTPFLLRHLPFWLAVLLGEPIVWLIPLLVILFPVFRVAPAAYDWFERRRIYSLYSELKRLEDEIIFAPADVSRMHVIERLNRLEDRASRLSVPTAFKPLVYSLRLHIDMVRQEVRSATLINTPEQSVSEGR